MFTLIPGVAVDPRVTRGAATSRTAYTALVALATAFAIGWAFVPIMVAGGDDTLDPRRFATFGADVRRIMPGIAVSAIADVARVVLLRPVGDACDHVGGRRAGGGRARRGRRAGAGRVVRRARPRVVGVGRQRRSPPDARVRSRSSASASRSAGAAYLAWRALAAASTGLFETDFTVLIDAFERTPLVSAVSAPAAAAQGDWWSAAWRLGLAVVWVVALVLRVAGQRRLLPLAPRVSGGCHQGAPRRHGPCGGIDVRTAPGATGADPRVRCMLACCGRGAPTRATSPASPHSWSCPRVFVALVVPAFGSTRAGPTPRRSCSPRRSAGAATTTSPSTPRRCGWTSSRADAGARSCADGSPPSRCGRCPSSWSPRSSSRAGRTTGSWPLRSWAPRSATLGSTLGCCGVTSVRCRTVRPRRARTRSPPRSARWVRASWRSWRVPRRPSCVVPFAVVPCVLAVVVDARWGSSRPSAGLAIGIGGYLAALTRWPGRIYDSRSGSLLAAVR